jgi:hypothetical protein
MRGEKPGDVLAGGGGGGKATWSVECSDALAWLQAMPDGAVDLVFFSPPYEGQRTYSLGFKLIGQAWVDWIRPIIRESARVSRGLVVVNASSPVRQHRYSPAVEWMVTDLTRSDGLVCGPAPWVWVKSENHEDADGNGTPGSGSTRYQRRDHEPLYAVCLPDRLPLKWTDNTAFGHPPKFGAGGEMSNRTVDGSRANDPWQKRGRGNNLGGREADGTKKLGTLARSPGTNRRASGERKTRHTKRVPGPDGDVMREQDYAPPAISNPGNVIRAPVGGGKLGHPLAHKSEAPMSLYVAERFVCWFAPPGGIVCDPFSGSGTTCHAAILHGRRFVGCDLRQSQADLVARRMATVTPALPLSADGAA